MGRRSEKRPAEITAPPAPPDEEFCALEVEGIEADLEPDLAELARRPVRPERDRFPVVLPDGTHLVLRPVKEDDRSLIAAGFQGLSQKSRHLRFFHAVTRLSEGDLDRLTRADQFHHVAWGAIDPKPPEPRGAALARFIRDPVDPGLAEFGLVVVDAFQSRGLGTVMLALLLVLAQPLGLRAIRGVVLDDNEQMLGWMRSLGAPLVREDGLVAVFELPVGMPLPGFPTSHSAVHLEAVRADLQALSDLAWGEPSPSRAVPPAPPPRPEGLS